MRGQGPKAAYLEGDSATKDSYLGWVGGGGGTIK